MEWHTKVRLGYDEKSLPKWWTLPEDCTIQKFRAIIGRHNAPYKSTVCWLIKKFERFRQDGVTCNTSWKSIDLLREKFPNRLMSLQENEIYPSRCLPIRASRGGHVFGIVFIVNHKLLKRMVCFFVVFFYRNKFDL